MKSARLILLMFLSLAVMSAGSFTTWASSESEVGKIAFCSSRAGNWEIYVMNPDGSDQTRLTHNRAYDIDPSWSPDGTKIAFWSLRDGNYEIYIMNADGSNQTRLTHNSASDTYPDWSPDGKKIAFHSYRDDNWEIYVMNADGSNQTRLTNNPGNDWEPSWSPDGKRIAFHSSSTPHSSGDIYVMNADGSNQTRLTHTSADEQDPAWSPDGRKIAFESDRDGNYEIYVMTADGSSQTRLTHNLDYDVIPTWSSDGTKLAFVRGPCVISYATAGCPGKSEIYLVDANGRNELRITNNSSDDDFPDWLVIPLPNKPPQARFTFSPAQPTVGQSVRFDASDSSDSDGTITSCAWNFGDGSTGSGKITTYTYNHSGSFTVILTVTDDDGASDSTSKEITVIEGNRPPQVISIDFPELVSTGVETKGTIGFADPDGDISQAKFEVLEGQLEDFTIDLSQSRYAETVRDKTEGSFDFALTVDQPGEYRIKVTLFDAPGLASEPKEFSFEARMPTAPAITKVVFPSMIKVNQEQTGIMKFEDPDGDVAQAELEVVEGDPATIEVKPAMRFNLGVQGRTKSSFRFSVIVTKAQTIKLRLTLMDSAGLRSEPCEFTFEVK